MSVGTGPSSSPPSQRPVTLPPNLPPLTAGALAAFADAAQTTLGADLRSIVLFGSAAEGRLRPTSDVNMIVVLRAFIPAHADGLRDPFRTAHAAIRLEAMFLLETEIDAAVEAFSVKFADVRRRRHVLLGDDPFLGITLSRAAEIARTKQVLLNLALRLRERYMLVSLREEQAALVIADAAGPLRAVAATLLELEGRPAAASPKAALAILLAEMETTEHSSAPFSSDLLANLSLARETRGLPPGVAGPMLLRLGELARRMADRAAALR